MNGRLDVAVSCGGMRMDDGVMILVMRKEDDVTLLLLSWLFRIGLISMI